MSAKDKMIDADASSVAYREYDYHMPDGTQGIVAVSLGKLGQQPSPAATFAYQNEARAYGHLMVLGVPMGLSRPILWMQTPSGLKVVATGDPEVSDELESLLLRVLGVFFRDVRDVAPGLGEP